MRSSVIAIVAAAFGMAAAFPGATVPVVTPQERDAGAIDAAACFIVAYEQINCEGEVGDNEGVPPGLSGVCIGVGVDSGPQQYSYELSRACPPLDVYLYYANGCSDNTPLVAEQTPGCYNIVADYTVNSILAVYADQ